MWKIFILPAVTGLQSTPAQPTKAVNLAGEYPPLTVPTPKWKQQYKEEFAEYETMQEHLKDLERLHEVLEASEKPVAEEKPKQ